jgi:hypothetical protein
MKTKLLLCIALMLSGVLLGCSSTPTQPATNKDLTKQISGILKECYKIKVGMTRSELLKVFTPDGGFQTGRTFVYHDCPYIKVDADFKHLNPQKNSVGDEEQPTDIISHISKPYMDWPITD